MDTIDVTYIIYVKGGVVFKKYTKRYTAEISEDVKYEVRRIKKMARARTIAQKTLRSVKVYAKMNDKTKLFREVVL